MRILTLARVPARRHRLERLHAGARARVEPRRPRRHRRLPGAAARALRPRRRATVVRPDVGGLLPVFVLDRYEGLEAQLLQDCTRRRARRASSRRTRRRCASSLPADLVFANHVLLGGPVGAATGAPFAVKAHGSELEYSMRGDAELAAWGRESLARRAAVFVGSAHIREVLRGGLRPRRPRPRGAARRRRRRVPPAAARGGARRRCSPRRAATRRTRGNANERLPDEGNAERLERVPRAATGRSSSTSASCSTTRASTSCSRRCAGSTRAP